MHVELKILGIYQVGLFAVSCSVKNQKIIALFGPKIPRSNISEFGVYLTETPLHFKDKTVHAVDGNNLCIYFENHTKYVVTA
jgi:hypothetical protein